MGQAQPRVTATTQQLNQSVSAVASSAGAATFSFQSPPQGLVWTGTLSCPGAPVNAVFLVSIGGTGWGDWAGNSVAGPVQAYANQQLIVTATGLTPGTSYDLIWLGSSDEPTGIEPIFPDTNSSAIAVALAETQGLVDLLYSNASFPLTGAAEVLGPLTALHSYAAVLLLISAPVGTVISAQVNWEAGPIVISGTFPSQTQSGTNNQPFSGNQVMAFLLLAPLQVGATFFLNLLSSTAYNATVEVYGLTQQPTQQVITPVGMPLDTYQVGGVRKVGIAAAPGNTNILPAPAAGFVYRIHRLGAFNAVTIWTDLGSGVVIAFTGGGVAGSPPPSERMDGQIVTGALQVDNTGGAAESAFVTYDLIPVQTLQ